MIAPDGPGTVPGASGLRDIPAADLVIRGARRADAPALVPLYADWDHPATAVVGEAVAG